MQVEGVLAGINVVKNDLNNLIFLEHKGVRVCSVNCWIGGEIACAERSVQGGYFGGYVGYIVEECAGR